MPTPQLHELNIEVDANVFGGVGSKDGIHVGCAPAVLNVRVMTRQKVNPEDIVSAHIRHVQIGKLQPVQGEIAVRNQPDPLPKETPDSLLEEQEPAGDGPVTFLEELPEPIKDESVKITSNNWGAFALAKDFGTEDLGELFIPKGTMFCQFTEKQARNIVAKVIPALTKLVGKDSTPVQEQTLTALNFLKAALNSKTKWEPLGK